ncbi:exo-alpha-sialidase [Geodermatophilus sp. DF01-2]|nr:exo-alpha-sialidase [Geodermatophilus sp. DF01_2]
MPSAHVHGVAVDPADGRVHLATHDGLFRYDETGPVRVGPVIDLMGFTVAGPDHFYASGHPGPGTDLPEPVGLIESTDGGATWTPLSRQGQSDFHALTASAAGVVGFDGTALSATSDGVTWRQLDPPVAPYALTASPDGAVLLATAESGPVRSTDAGASWSVIEGAPLLQVVDWAGGQSVVGVTPDGTVAVSDDAGATWSVRGSVAGPPQAVGASTTAEGTLRILVVTADGILDSLDGGVSLAPLQVG